jgi:hypothetical protein
MENESTFVAPEGVYSVTEEHKPAGAQAHIVTVPSLFPTRLSSVVVRFTGTKQGGAPGFAQLLSGNKEFRKEKGPKERDDGVSLSSSDTPDEGEQPSAPAQDSAPTSPTVLPHEPHTLFSHPPVAGKKKNVSRPKHNIRTTSSTFITRIQNTESLTKTLQSKHGDCTFLFYNLAKSFLWVEAGSKTKVQKVLARRTVYSSSYM